MTSVAIPESRSKRLVLAACILGSMIVFLDQTVTNVALPAIERDLGGGLAGQQWVTNAYLLTLGSLLLVGGSLGDIYGERKVFSLGVAGFGVTSALCAAAPTIEVLVAGRALQGVAGALLVPSTLAVIVANFPPDERGAAIGSWTAWTGVATVLGPLVGGQLIDSVSWRWIFGINVPLVIVTLYLIAAHVPAGRPRGGRVDWVGGALCALGLAGPVFALIEQPMLGWGDPLVLGSLAGGLAIFAAFLLWERRAPAPMLPLDLFRVRNFAVGNAETLLVYGGLSVIFFFLVLFLQQVAGYDAFEAGLATLPTTVVMFALSKRFGALADRYGPRFFMSAGPLIGAVGVALLLRLEESFDYLTELLPGLLLFSLGLTLMVAPLTAAILAAADEHNAGIASGVNNAVARVAGLLGIAVVGLLVAGRFETELDANLAERGVRDVPPRVIRAAKDRPLGGVSLAGVPAPERQAVADAIDESATSAFHVAMGAAALLMAAGGLVAAVGIENPRRAVLAEECPGGAFAPSKEAAGCPEAHLPAPPRPVPAGAEP